MRAILFLLFAGVAQAQDLEPADLSLADMHLGKSTLQEVLSHFGIAPLRHGAEVDELCYRSENPILAYWVLFGAADITCSPSARLTTELATESGIRLGMPAEELKPKLGPRLRVTVDSGRVTSYLIKLNP
jgi:hypothetical protein